MDKLSEEQVKQYILHGGVNCPICRSGYINASGDCHADASRVYREIICPDCSAIWTEGYTLDSVGTGKGGNFQFIYPEDSKPESNEVEIAIAFAAKERRGGCTRYTDCHDLRAAMTRQALQDRIAAIYIARAIKGFLKGGQKTVADLARFMESIAGTEST